jgi:hydrogenase small subunit
LPGFKGFGIEKTADKIGIGLGIVTAAGIAAHAISTNIQKRKEINLGDTGEE